MIAKQEFPEDTIEQSLEVLATAFIHIIVQDGFPSFLQIKLIPSMIFICKAILGITEEELVEMVVATQERNHLKDIVRSGYKHWLKYLERERPFIEANQGK